MPDFYDTVDFRVYGTCSSILNPGLQSSHWDHSSKSNFGLKSYRIKYQGVEHLDFPGFVIEYIVRLKKWSFSNNSQPYPDSELKIMIFSLCYTISSLLRWLLGFSTFAGCLLFLKRQICFPSLKDGTVAHCTHLVNVN